MWGHWAVIQHCQGKQQKWQPCYASNKSSVSRNHIKANQTWKHIVAHLGLIYILNRQHCQQILDQRGQLILAAVLSLSSGV